MQLQQRNCNSGEISDVYPITTLDKVVNLETNESLNQILEKYNHILLPFKSNSKTLTRQQVPNELRRRGLWITYTHCKCNVITEWYNSDRYDNKSWGDNNNWIQIVDKATLLKINEELSNKLVGWYKYSDKNEVSGNVKDLFHWYGSTVAFVTHKNQGLIPLDSIAFLHTGQIYVQGKLIGVSSEEFGALEKSVKKVLEIFEQGDTDGTINDLSSVLDFIKGFEEGQTLKGIIDGIKTTLNDKVDKAEGKGLSTNDFTDELKNKLENLNPFTKEEIKEICK